MDSVPAGAGGVNPWRGADDVEETFAFGLDATGTVCGAGFSGRLRPIVLGLAIREVPFPSGDAEKLDTGLVAVIAVLVIMCVAIVICGGIAVAYTVKRRGLRRLVERPVMRADTHARINLSPKVLPSDDIDLDAVERLAHAGVVPRHRLEEASVSPRGLAGVAVPADWLVRAGGGDPVTMLPPGMTQERAPSPENAVGLSPYSIPVASMYREPIETVAALRPPPRAQRRVQL
eukprot:TRINITY_DN68442_c0_g1_i1.p2 TRINITY_DN68442_c0_g1~~TRINITY_DN68442_c0_g1_i1.p2  ORF type:complete len:232 (+),score=61.84 TRINITY_DN68442_c0_g1_i1:140-835(+)